MSAFQIKLLACIFMVIDHIGYILFPQYIIFRVIGRLSFPIFAWFISLGYKHTRSVIGYMKRLGILALLYQLPLIFFENLGKTPLNIFFTLFLGLLSIYIYDKEEKMVYRIIKVLIIGLLAEFIKVDYGFYGIITIVLFHIFNSSLIKLWKAQILLNVLYALITNIYLYYMNNNINRFVFIQIFSVMALVFVYFYNFNQGKKMKVFFYSFYPVHIVVLYLISITLNKQ